MSNTAMIEVFGPEAETRAALLALPAAGHRQRSRTGALVVELGAVALVVTRDLAEEPTTVLVDGEDVDRHALEVFKQLAALLPYPLLVKAADTADVIASRGAVPAA